jgi:hypothetical protein
VLLGAACLLIQLVVLTHSDEIPNISGLMFCFELTSVVYEIAAMIYASGPVVFGTTTDALVVLSIAVANCILVYTNCPSISQQRPMS